MALCPHIVGETLSHKSGIGYFEIVDAGRCHRKLMKNKSSYPVEVEERRKKIVSNGSKRLLRVLTPYLQQTCTPASIKKFFFACFRKNICSFLLILLQKCLFCTAEKVSVFL